MYFSSPRDSRASSPPSLFLLFLLAASPGSVRGSEATLVGPAYCDLARLRLQPLCPAFVSMAYVKTGAWGQVCAVCLKVCKVSSIRLTFAFFLEQVLRCRSEQCVFLPADQV